MTYANKTGVSPEKTMAEIQTTLKRYKAASFAFGSNAEKIVVSFEAHERRVRFTVPLPKRADFRPTSRDRAGNAAEKRYDQAVRSRWRALLLTIKAKLESVESGIETFEEAFMSQLVLPTGQTMAEFAIPQIRVAYETGDMPPLLGSGL